MRPSTIRIIISFLTLLAFGIFQPARAAPDSYHIVIEGGKIVDGTGGPLYYGDVGIKDGRIKKIGDLKNSPTLKNYEINWSNKDLKYVMASGSARFILQT
jgi:urease alpha subunit